MLGCNISDTGAKCLSSLKLNGIDLQQNLLTEQGVAYFFNHPSLTFFNFNANSLNANTLKKIEQSLVLMK